MGRIKLINDIEKADPEQFDGLDGSNADLYFDRITGGQFIVSGRNRPGIFNDYSNIVVVQVFFRADQVPV